MPDTTIKQSDFAYWVAPTMLSEEQRQAIQSQTYFYSPGLASGGNGGCGGAAPSRSYTAQEINRIVESSREEGRRIGYGEGYDKGYANAQDRLSARATSRLNMFFNLLDAHKTVAEEKADAADCYDGEKVRFSWKFHALKLKKLIEELDAI